jgi:hypothetical protein
MAVDAHCPSVLLKKFKLMSNDNEYYACALNQADVINNCNKSYIMQMFHRSGETFVIYSRFGRVGHVGSMNTEIYVDKDQTIKEFKRLFYDKTGILWDERYTDTTIHSGKYQFIIMKSDNVKTLDKEPEDLVGDLHPQIQRFVEIIYDPALYDKTADSYNIDTRKLPLGSLGVSQINKANQIIKQLSDLVDRKGQEDKIAELSSLFYTCVPSALSKLKLIDTMDMVKDKAELMDFLGNMCYMSQSIDKNIVSKYLQLETNLDHVTDAETISMITSYANTNVGSTHNMSLKIKGIYEINKPKEKQAYNKWSGLHNKQLLWHGTRLANAVGILTMGMRINPVGVPTTGKMFGNGLYFANSSTKSAAYMGLKSKGMGIMFLCEVALGNMYERLHAESVVKLPSGKHSTKGVGCNQPNPDDHIVINDVTVPIGKLQATSNGGALHYDEFIVYDVSQIKMRYAILIDYTPRW